MVCKWTELCIDCNLECTVALLSRFSAFSYNCLVVTGFPATENSRSTVVGNIRRSSGSTMTNESACAERTCALIGGLSNALSQRHREQRSRKIDGEQRRPGRNFDPGRPLAPYAEHGECRSLTDNQMKIQTSALSLQKQT